MSSGKVRTLEHGGELWVRLADVHPMQDKIITLESRLKEAENLLGQWSLGLEQLDDQAGLKGLRSADEASTAWLASIPRYVPTGNTDL